MSKISLDAAFLLVEKFHFYTASLVVSGICKNLTGTFFIFNLETDVDDSLSTSERLYSRFKNVGS